MVAAMGVVVLASIAGGREARGEGVMCGQVVEVTPNKVNLGTNPRLADLSAATVAIGAAANSGDTQAAEERLGALFSGSGICADAASVYISPRPTAPTVSRGIPVAPPKAAYKAALEDLEDIEDGEDRKDEDIKPSAAEDGDDAAKDDVAAARELPPPPLWYTLLSGILGIMVVLMLIGFFPAPLLFV
jgi:hypothetical protein